MTAKSVLQLISILWITLLPGTAMAYIGPGAGLSAIGTLIALVGAVLLAIIGFVWYPLKRMLRSRKQAADPATDQDQRDSKAS